jgi:hypothetical protein
MTMTRYTLPISAAPPNRTEVRAQDHADESAAAQVANDLGPTFGRNVVLNVSHRAGEHSRQPDEEGRPRGVQLPRQPRGRQEHQAPADVQQGADRPHAARAIVVQHMRDAQSQDDGHGGPERDDVARGTFGPAEVVDQFGEPERERVPHDKQRVGQVCQPEDPAVDSGHRLIGGNLLRHRYPP